MTMSILCQNCKQANATVHLTDIQANGEPVERHLCEICAAQEGVTMKPHEPAKMLEEFVKMGAGMREAVQRTCPQCGISFGEFRAQGQLGCPHDYEAFANLLMPLIERAHDGATVHVGKHPGKQDPRGRRRMRVSRLRRELDAAVAGERYELAAKLRDQLRELEGEGESGHES